MTSIRIRLLALLGVVVFGLSSAVLLAQNAPTPDSNSSRLTLDKTFVRADGIDSANVFVIVRDQNLLPLTGAQVTLMSSRGPMDEIIQTQPKTDSLGQISFIVRSLRNGTSTFTMRVGNALVNRSVTITFENGLAIPLQVGDLIKIPDDGDAKNLSDTAVYYYAMNGKRYVFPNEKTYFTWYPDFSSIKIITNDQMSLIPIGGNVTYKAGSRMVKFQTDVKTYLVTKGGVLRWVRTEEVARGLYGNAWNTFVDDISEAFYINYRFGQPLDSPLNAPLDLIRTSVQTIDQDQGIIDTRFP